MAYAFNQACFPDVASALSAFQSTFPQIAGTQIVNLTTSSIDASGLITFVTQTRAFTTATWTTNPSSTVQLPTCATDSLGGFPLQDVMLGFAIVVCWSLGVLAGMHR